jgi:hypothetical protein
MGDDVVRAVLSAEEWCLGRARCRIDTGEDRRRGLEEEQVHVAVGSKGIDQRKECLASWELGETEERHAVRDRHLEIAVAKSVQ